jgi:hypothetical protein
MRILLRLLVSDPTSRNPSSDQIEVLRDRTEMIGCDRASQNKILVADWDREELILIGI